MTEDQKETELVKAAMREASASQPRLLAEAYREAMANFRPTWGDRIVNVPRAVLQGIVGLVENVIKLVDDAQGSITGKHLFSLDEYQEMADQQLMKTALGGLIEGLISSPSFWLLLSLVLLVRRYRRRKRKLIHGFPVAVGNETGS